MKELNVTITMDENGNFKVSTTEGMPIFNAIGMLEVAKNVLLKGGTVEDADMPSMPDQADTSESEDQ